MTPPSAAQPLIHIGYMKTGSSWLQQRIFSDARTRFTAPWSIDADVRDRFILANAFEFDAVRTATHFAPGCEPAASRSMIPVLTNERLAGSPNSGGHDGRAIADRLAATFPGAKVLVVIREQRRMIVSSYKQYVKMGGASSFSRFVHPPDRGRGRVPLFDFRLFEYDLLIAYYQQLFGSEQVLALPFELLQRDRAAFVQHLVDFTGACLPPDLQADVVNPGLSGFSAALKRRANLLLVRDRVNPAAPLDAPRVNEVFTSMSRGLDRRLPASWRAPWEDRLQRLAEEATVGRYEGSNRRVTELIGFNLEALGYGVDTVGPAK